MNAKDVFVDNMNTVIGKNKVKDLVRQASEQGINIDYTYLMDVRRGARNPSIDKLEQVVGMLKLLNGYSNIEFWMFFVPGYFAKQLASEYVANEKPVDEPTNPVGPVLSEQEFVGKVTDALMMYHYFDWVKIDNEKMDFDAAGKYMLKQVGPLVGVESSIEKMLNKAVNQ